jgi:hypothetical protein
MHERPRKTLGFETPAAKFNACVASIGLADNPKESLDDALQFFSKKRV